MLSYRIRVVCYESISFCDLLSNITLQDEENENYSRKLIWLCSNDEIHFVGPSTRTVTRLSPDLLSIFTWTRNEMLSYETFVGIDENL